MEATTVRASESDVDARRLGTCGCGGAVRAW